jgi:peptidoglycan-N-acetylglucosamine deacetylase
VLQSSADRKAIGRVADMEKPRIVTTSWDDGNRADLRIAELLRSRGILGTFYVPISPYQGQPSLSHADLKSLSSEGFEIGAHGFSHQLLWGQSAEVLAREIGPCKPILEAVLGSEVRMFCYPRGRYDTNVVRFLTEAGYRGARTVHMLSTNLKFSPFEMPTTMQVFPHPMSSYIKNILRTRKVETLQAGLANVAWLGNWLELGKKLFDSVRQNGGVWHLYGHSWEIHKLGLWKELEELLDYVSNRKDVLYVSNCELVRLLTSNTAAVSGAVKS